MSIKTKDSKEICEEPDVHESGILGIKVSGNDSIPYITIKADGRIDVSDTSKKEDDISTFPIHRIGIIVVLVLGAFITFFVYFKLNKNLNIHMDA